VLRILRIAFLLFVAHKICASNFFFASFYWFVGFFRVLLKWVVNIEKEASICGSHTLQVQKGLRIGFLLFICSEIMFFLSFFWAFFHASLSPSVQLGCVWPPTGVSPINPFGLPLLNTAILLLSGASLTCAHKNLLANNSTCLKDISDPCIVILGLTIIFSCGNLFVAILTSVCMIVCMWFSYLWGYDRFLKASAMYLSWTILLGVLFIWVQHKEYVYCSFNISSSVLGSSFFVLTGFHGAHVGIGIIFLFKALMGLLYLELKMLPQKKLGTFIINLFAGPNKPHSKWGQTPQKPHTSPHHHLGLEIAIWY